MYGEAIGEQQRGRALVSTGPQGLGSLGRSYAVAGKKAEARNILDKLLENSRRGQSVTLDIANVYAALDDKDLALQWLERAYNERNTSLALVNVDPDWESFRSEPRFTNLLKKMGLAK